MRLRVTVCGYEIFAAELVRQDPTELLADAIAEMNSGNTAGDDEPPNYGTYGTSACHLERSPETDWYGEDKGFGFSKKPD